MEQRVESDISPYRVFSREEWAARRENTPMTLTQSEIIHLQALNDKLSALLWEAKAATPPPGEAPAGTRPYIVVLHGFPHPDFPADGEAAK